jgi:hypothetical protein
VRRDYKPPAASPADHELVTQLKRLRYDLTEMQGKVSEALRMAAQLKLESAPPHTCPECKTAGITHDLRTTAKLAEHRYHAHDGPLPNHYAKAEAAAE